SDGVAVRLRLRQDHFFSVDFSAAHQRLALGPLHADPVAIRQFIHGHETQIMRRPLILRIGIPKSDNEPHRLFPAARQTRDKLYFFFSPFSTLSLFSALGLASASAPSSPSTSFLPFFVTSRS